MQESLLQIVPNISRPLAVNAPYATTANPQPINIKWNHPPPLWPIAHDGQLT